MAEAKRGSILSVLKARFGPVPADLDSRLATAADAARLEELTEWAVLYPDLESFLRQLGP